MDLEPHLALALELADLADAITMRHFRTHDLRVETKPDLTPVSEADHAVEHAIREHLATAARDHAVLGEEFGAGTGEGDGEIRWIVDPIDGTKSYVRGIPIWATLLGLEVAGELVVGAVSAPALHMRWWAARGHGAFRDGEPLTVSAVHELADAQLSFTWDAVADLEADGLDVRLMDLSRRCWRSRGIGDFWQHLLVAEGAFDVAIDPVVSLWDVAALVPILEEAGGRWSGTGGERSPGAGGFVSTNGTLHDSVLSVLAVDEP